MLNLNIDFSAGVDSAYAELPVPAARLKWVRGNPALKALKDVDPAAYWGGWRAMVRNNDGEPLPPLPIGIYDRVSSDGRKNFQVFGTPVLNFIPLAHRTRYELREKTTDPTTGEERTTIKATAKDKLPGYTPRKEIFGLVFNEDMTEYEPGLIVLDNWSAYINFQRAEQRFAKSKAPAGKALVRRYGTIGKVDKTTGQTNPFMEQVGQGLTTPIEAIGFANPHFIEVTEDIAKLYYDAQDWADCPKWNAVGTRGGEEDTLSAKSQFLSRAQELRLSETEIEQILAESNGDYRDALKAINDDGLAAGGNEDDLVF